MLSRSWYWMLSLFIVLGIPLPASAESTYQGRVLSVEDGDTLMLLTQTGARLKIRLAEIDAPELTQRYGKQARQGLANMALGREARVLEQTQDRYGRVVGRVYVNDLDVSAELLQLGMAWSYRQYAQDKTLFPLEQQARLVRHGLWADAQPIPPWTFRHSETPVQELQERRSAVVYRCKQADGRVVYSQTDCGATGESLNVEWEQTVRQRASAKIDGRTSSHERLCNRKPTCATLRDCSEARFFFVVCRFRYLDHNSDGTPCEQLCR